MQEDRFDRNERFFGREGQERLRKTNVAIVGAGGLGSHVVQQLAYLGIGALALIDAQTVKRSHLNRYVTVHHRDPENEPLKVEVAEHLIRAINPAIEVTTVPHSLVSTPAFEAVQTADFVFGCLDSEGARLVLTELCAAYCRPYYDLASDIISGERLSYGGRLCIADARGGCLVCRGLLDMEEAQQELASPSLRQNRAAVYGVGVELLGRADAGPSVVSINGVVASLAVTEFMLEAAAIRPSEKLLLYRGNLGKVTVPIDAPKPDCFYCKLWGCGDAADVERYIRAGVGDYLQ